MASSEYTYDEEGDVWPYFLLAVLSFVLIPLTIRYFVRLFDASNPRTTNAKIAGSIQEDHKTLGVNEENISQYHKSETSDKIFNKTLIVLVLGWGAVIYIAFNLTKVADISTIFDPYEILGISSSSTDKQIKSHYRKLSLKFHPDKMPKDLSELEKETFEQAYIRLNKAYKALTDEVTRENFLKYGHPDGKQDTSHGIALPKFLVEGEYSLLMIVFYFILIGGLLPYLVGSWWNNVRSHTSRGLHVDTAGLFARYFTDKNPGKVVTPFEILDLLLKTREVKDDFSHLSTAKIHDLVIEYWNREVNPSLESDKLKIVATLPKLIEGFVEIATVFRQPDVILAALDLNKSIIQAVKPNGKYQDLLQLPYVDPKVIESQPIKKLGKLFTLSNDELKDTLGIQDDTKLAKTLEVASKIASLRVIESDFKVPGEKFVTPASKAHVSLKFLVKSPKLKSCPESKEESTKDDEEDKEEEEEEEEEEDLEYLKDPTKLNGQQPELPYSYAPYFPGKIRNNWSGVLINQRDNKLVEGSTPIRLTNIDLSNIGLDQETWIKGEKVVTGTFNIPFAPPTPQQPGVYPYRLILKNNAYFGVDIDIPLFMEVKNPPPAPINKEKILGKDVDSDDSDSDISDPEEDSLAGALAAMRGAPVKKAKIEEINEEEEEEAEEDDDSGSVFTDIDTDTEDEDE